MESIQLKDKRGMHTYTHVPTHTHTHTKLRVKNIMERKLIKKKAEITGSGYKLGGSGFLRNYLKKDMTKVKEGAIQIPG